MIKIIRDSITYKLLLLMTVIMTLTVITMTLIDYYTAKQRLYSQLELQATTILDGLNYAIEGFLINHDVTSIQRMVSNISATNDIISISIINRDNKIIADSDPSQINKIVNNPLVTKAINSEKLMIWDSRYCGLL